MAKTRRYNNSRRKAYSSTKRSKAQRKRRLAEKEKKAETKIYELMHIPPRQMELRALREAGLLNDVAQEIPRDVQNNNSVQQTSNALNDSVHRVSQDTNTLDASSVSLDINFSEVASSVSQVSNFSQVTPTAVVKDFSTFPISCTSHTLPYNQPHTSSLVDIAGTSTSSVVSSIQGSSEMRIISNNDSSTLPLVSTAVRTTERVSKFIAEQKIHDLSQKVILKPLNKKPKLKPVVISGRRIIDFEFFLNSLKCVNSHSDNGCNLNDMIVTGEVKRGLYSAFKLNCTVCDFEETIHSESQYRKKNLNADFVAGMVSINRRFESTNKLLKKLRLPLLDYAYFTNECAKILLSKEKNKRNTKTLKKRSQATVDENYNFPTTYTTLKKCKKDLTCQKTKKKMAKNSQAPADENYNFPITYTTFKKCKKDLTCQKTKKIEKNTEKETLLENVDLSELLVEDHIEIKEERDDNGHGNDFETIAEEAVIKTCEDNVVKTKEQESLNMTMIKQEINSDVEEDLIGSTTSEMETLDKGSLIECDDRSIQLKQVRSCEEKMAVDQEEVEFNKTPVTQNTQDGSKFNEPEFNGTEINKTSSFTSKLNQTCFEFDNQPETELPLKKCRTATHENRVVVNQDDIKIDDKEAKQKLYSVEDCERLAKLKNTMVKKRVVSCHKTKCGKKTDDQQISRSETNGLVTATSSTLGGENASSFIPLQYMPKQNSDVMGSQMPHHLTNRTYNGVNQTAFIPITSTVIQQQTGESNNALLPLVTQHSPPVSIYSSSNQNPITILPGVNQTAFIPVSSAVIQQQTGKSNSVLLPLFTQHPPSVSNYSISSQNPLIVFPGVSGTTYVPSPPAIIQQLTNLSNTVPLPSTSDDSRWIRPQNIISNNPSFSFSSEVPKKMSDPIPFEPNIGQPNH